jgi:type II secretory pathway predicted ATPase ExeA
MYIEHFGLAELPFSISPDPRYLYLTPQHREALAKAQYIVAQKGGLAVVYGDVGHGKTTVARRLYHTFKEDQNIQTALLITPDLKTDSALLRSVMAEFGVPPRRSHALSLAAFHALPILPAIKSRVAMFGALTNLTRQDMEAMIEFRWKAAGGRQHPFSTESLDVLYELSRGKPREVNKLANESLIRAFVNGQDKVSADMVRGAAKELRLDTLPAAPAAKAKPARTKTKAKV